MDGLRRQRRLVDLDGVIGRAVKGFKEEAWEGEEGDLGRIPMFPPTVEKLSQKITGIVNQAGFKREEDAGLLPPARISRGVNAQKSAGGKRAVEGDKPPARNSSVERATPGTLRSIMAQGRGLENPPQLRKDMAPTQEQGQYLRAWVIGTLKARHVGFDELPPAIKAEMVREGLGMFTDVEALERAEATGNWRKPEVRRHAAQRMPTTEPEREKAPAPAPYVAPDPQKRPGVISQAMSRFAEEMFRKHKAGPEASEIARKRLEQEEWLKRTYPDFRSIHPVVREGLKEQGSEMGYGPSARQLRQYELSQDSENRDRVDSAVGHFNAGVLDSGASVVKAVEIPFRVAGYDPVISQAMNDAAQDWRDLQGNPNYPVSNGASSAAGAMLPQVMVAGGAKAAGASEKAVAGISVGLGIGGGAGEGYDEAVEAGASNSQVVTYTLVRAGLGATEAIPLNRALSRFDKATGGTLSRNIAKRVGQPASDALAGAVEETIQSVYQQYGENAAKEYVLKLEVELTDGVNEAALSGAGSATRSGVIGLGRSLNERVKRQREANEAKAVGGPDDKRALPAIGVTGDGEVGNKTTTRELPGGGLISQATATTTPEAPDLPPDLRGLKGLSGSEAGWNGGGVFRGRNDEPPSPPNEPPKVPSNVPSGEPPTEPPKGPPKSSPKSPPKDPPEGTGGPGRGRRDVNGLLPGDHIDVEHLMQGEQSDAFVAGFTGYARGERIGAPAGLDAKEFAAGVRAAQENQDKHQPFIDRHLKELGHEKEFREAQLKEEEFGGDVGEESTGEKAEIGLKPVPEQNSKAGAESGKIVIPPGHEIHLPQPPVVKFDDGINHEPKDGHLTYKNPVEPGLKTQKSGVSIVLDPKRTTTLVGAYDGDLDGVIRSVDYHRYDGNIDGLVHGAKPGGLNMLNVSDRFWHECQALTPDGFFQRVNAPWVDASVARRDRILVGSDVDTRLRNKNNELTGFGREIERYEKVHGMRYDSATGEMVYPDHPSHSSLKAFFTNSKE
jgi:hypothetical protein